MINSTLLTLGRAELRSGDALIDCASSVPAASGIVVPLQPKRLALLAYLAVTSADGATSRDKLIAFLWPEAATEEGRAALRQALHHLRQRASEDAITSTSDGKLQLDRSRLRCDAVDLELAAAKGDHARAVSLYGGEFLEGLSPRDTSPEFEEWIDRQRRRLRGIAAASAKRLVDGLVKSGKLEDAVSVGLRRIDIVPDDEEAVRTAVQMLEQVGRAGDAIALAERSMREFEARLGVPAAAETKALVTAIRARRKAQAANVPSLPNDAAPQEKPVQNQPPGFTASARARRLPQLLAIASVVILAIIAYQAIDRSNARSATETAATAQTRAGQVDRLIVADFRDDGSGLGAAVAAALRVDLSQSPSVRVLTSAQLRDAARRSEIAGDVSVDDSLVRTLATREGVKAFVTGAVNRAGANWLMTAQLVDPRDGSAIVSVRETAEDSSGLLPAIERLSRKLTARSYSALASQPSAQPLARVTTASLSALRSYSEGVRLLDSGERLQGIAMLEQAVQQDSAFATAWRVLGSTWSGMGEPARSERALRQAFAHRDRLPFRERHLTEGSYYRNFSHDFTAAVAAYRTLLSAYPNDVAALNNLALVYVSLNAHAQAESLFVRVIAIDTTLVHARLTLAEQIAMQRRHADAERVMNEAARRFPDNPTVQLTPIYLAASAQNWARAESLAVVRLASGVQEIQRVDALQTLAQIEMVRGEIARADQHLRDAMTGALEAESPYRYLSIAVTSAWLSLRYRGDVAGARATLKRALERVPLRNVPDADRPLAALTSIMLASGMKDDAEQLTGGADARNVSAEERELVRALFQVHNGLASEGVAILNRASASAMECAMCLLPTLADARALAGDTAGAIRAAEEYLDSPYIHRFEPDAIELPELLTRLAVWCEKRGDAARAGKTRQRLLELWSNADASLASRMADLRRQTNRAPH